jgi:hypothetical protein
MRWKGMAAPWGFGQSAEYNDRAGCLQSQTSMSSFAELMVGSSTIARVSILSRGQEALLGR